MKTMLENELETGVVKDESGVVETGMAVHNEVHTEAATGVKNEVEDARNQVLWYVCIFMCSCIYVILCSDACL